MKSGFNSGRSPIVEYIVSATIDSDDYAVDNHDLGLSIPDNAIVTDFYVDVTTGFTSGGSATVQLVLNSSTPVVLLAQAPFGAGGGNANWNTTGIRSGTMAYSFVGGKGDSAADVRLTVGTAALTAGAAKLYVKYIIGT